MRAACAYCLCKLLCAKDPEAAKIIQDGLCENSLPNIFDDSVKGAAADPRSFMQLKHQISFVGMDMGDDESNDEHSANKLMEQMCRYKDVFNGATKVSAATSNSGNGTEAAEHRHQVLASVLSVLSKKNDEKMPFPPSIV